MKVLTQNKKMKNINAVYIGVRINSEKLYDAFLYENEELLFKHRRRYLIIGNEYQLFGSDKENVAISKFPKLITENKVIDEEQINLWCAEEELAKSTLKRIKLRNKANTLVQSLSKEIHTIAHRLPKNLGHIKTMDLCKIVGEKIFDKFLEQAQRSKK